METNKGLVEIGALEGIPGSPVIEKKSGYIDLYNKKGGTTGLRLSFY